MLEIRMRVGPKGQVVIPKVLRDAFKIGPGTEVTFSMEAERIVMRATRTDSADVLEGSRSPAGRSTSSRRTPPTSGNSGGDVGDLPRFERVHLRRPRRGQGRELVSRSHPPGHPGRGRGGDLCARGGRGRVSGTGGPGP